MSGKRRKRNSLLLLLILILIALVTALLVYYQMNNNQLSSSKSTDDARNQSSKPDPNIKFIATGDWIAHDSVNAAAQQANGSYNYMPLVSDFIPIFQQADIRFCNDPILNGGESLGISGYPKFNSPTEFVTDMGKLGCNLVNLASNHSFDFTQANINNSVTAWQNTPNVLAFAGENQNQQQHDSVRYFSVKGVKFAFIAYTTYINTDAPAQNSYGVNLFSQAFASNQIAQAKQNGAKFIVASMRWGNEYSVAITDQQRQDAQWLADQGVNLILGHGTHILQPVQWLNGSGGNKTLVWYGLGDFLHSQEPADTVFDGVASMEIEPSSLQITDISFLPIYMHYAWTSQQQAADDISARTNLHLYLLQDVTQNMINAQQLNTTVQAQEQRMESTLSSEGVSVPLITTQQYYQTN